MLFAGKEARQARREGRAESAAAQPLDLRTSGYEAGAASLKPKGGASSLTVPGSASMAETLPAAEAGAVPESWGGETESPFTDGPEADSVFEETAEPGIEAGPAAPAAAAPQSAAPAVDPAAEVAKVKDLVNSGTVNGWAITDALFQARHPELQGQPLPKPEGATPEQLVLINEYQTIYQTVVKPNLPVAAPRATAPASAAKPTAAAASASSTAPAPAEDAVPKADPSRAAAVLAPFVTMVPGTSYYASLDEAALGRFLAPFATSAPDLVLAVFEQLSATDRDDVAYELTASLADGAITSLSRSMRDYLTAQLSGGWASSDELAQAGRLATPAAPTAVDSTASTTAAAPVARGDSGVHLTAAQSTTALQYYEKERARHVEGVIKAIQTKVGAPVTGQVDAAFADAVAGYQAGKGLEADGMAGEGTLVAMFGMDIRMRADSVDPALVRSSDGMDRVNSSVTVTPAIIDAWTRLLPNLPAAARMTSGVRSWEKTVQLMVSYVKKKQPKMVELGLATAEQIDNAIANADFGTLYQLANEDYDTNGDGKDEDFVVAAVGNSPHITGLAFDMSGGSLSAIKAAIDKTKAEDPNFKLKKIIVESGNNCVHTEVTG